jgi:hypothetical protein
MAAALQPARLARWSRRQDLVWVLGAAALSTIAGSLVTQTFFLRVVLALIAAATLVICAVAAPRAVLYGLVVWMFALGLVRRLVGTVGPGGPLDPLLLVGPVVLAALVASTTARSSFRARTPLANLVLAMSGLLVLSALNPLQGGPLVGIAGLLFTVVPMLGFWIGRAAGDDYLVGGILKLYAALSVLAAAYGLYQTFAGLPAWDERWTVQGGYTALNVGGVIRAFGTSSSASEYVTLVAIGIVAWFTLSSRPLLAAPPLALLGCACFYASMRSVVFGLALTLAVVGAIRWRLPLPAIVAIGFASLFTIVWLAGRLLPATEADHPTAALVEHQLGGLADPLDPEASTFALHLEYFRSGLTSAFSNPVGHGVGVVTIASSKFGGSARGTELDVSNMAVAAGLPGLVLYLFLAGAGMARAYKVARLRRSRLALCALGVLLVMALQWLNGGQYSVAVLPWFLLGWLDRQQVELAGPADLQQPPPVAILREASSCS